MQFNSKTNKLTMTKREQQTLVDAKAILLHVGRIKQIDDADQAAEFIGETLATLAADPQGTLPVTT